MILKLFELIETGKGSQTLMRSEVNLSRLLRQIVLEHEPLAEERGISVTTDIQEDKIMISLDLEKITRVMNNLMSNAVKYCSESGKIHASLETGENSVLLTINNTSSEMKEEDMENLFKKFYRGDKARNSAIEGNGIGLSIAKNIVELHDGKIWAEYANGEISFIIRLRR
jgi:signal transduction histidine kinase